MPYFIYRILPGPTKVITTLEKLQQFDNFQEAKTSARNLRAEQSVEDSSQIKVMFAANQLRAEEELLEKREAPILREWEK
ncbi:MAG TPA: hypothetical protein ENI62_11420 [Gammaproteobacteria bacterium]|nr:hypothetical protein [Gammaproteobacteria bacterium]